MKIHEIIEAYLDKTTQLRNEHPEITNIRYEIMDMPYEDLLEFSESQNTPIHTDYIKSRAFILVTPWNRGNKIDTDIWIYSNVVKIKPAEITEL